MSIKTFLFLSPLLWFRKIIVIVLLVFILLGALVYFVANAPWVIQKAADSFAPDYNITYSRIHGNVLTGVEIEGLSYNHKLLSKHVRLKWNPNGLLKKEILINHLVLEKVNVDTIKALVHAFSSEDNSSSSPFTFGVKVKKLAIDIDPFIVSNVKIKNSVLHTTNVYYKGDDLQVGALGLVLDTNITKLILKASLHNGTVDVKELDIQDLDTIALQKVVLAEINSSTETSAKENTSARNPLVPTHINLHTLHANILARVYAPLTIKQLNVELNETRFDIDKLMLEKGHISLFAQTNLANLKHEGNIVNNQLKSDIKVTPKSALFTQYALPIREDAIDSIDIKLDANKERIIAKIDTQLLQVLKAKKDAFNLDIDSLKSTLTYRLEAGTLKADSKATVTTPYAKDVQVTNHFSLDDNISYSGDISFKKMRGLEAKFVKPLNDLYIQYRGNQKSIEANLHSQMLKGDFVSSDFKTGTVHIESKEAVLLRDFVALPKELNATKASMRIDMPLDFESNASIIAHAQVQSNVATIDANVSYKDTLHLTSTIDVPQDSLLRPYVKDLKWEKIMPIKVKAALRDESLEAKVDAGVIDATVVYALNSTEVTGNINMSGLKTMVSGNVQKHLQIVSTVGDIPSLMKSISSVYTLEALPKIEGSAKLLVDINALKKIDVALTSPLVVYHSDHKTSTDISNIDVLVHYEEGEVVLKHYSVQYDKEKIYATKPSKITLNENNITLSPLWINDALKAEGSYDVKTKKGKIVAKADKLHVSHEIIDLDNNVDVTALFDGNKTNVQGKVILLGGDIHYDISQKSFASDSDIIIVQDMKKKNESPFMDGLSAELQVQTKKPLVYNAQGIHMKANVDVTVHKAEGSELLVLGSVTPLKGSTYVFQNKKFVVDKSAVYFTGNPNKPLLDIKVNYKALNYLVTISITGSADLPHIAFASKPSLNREQILSLILFDSVEAAGTNSGDQMMKMMGGAMAKSALNDLGVQIDHLVLGEGNSVEVGKKLTNKITIIYVNGDVAEVKLKYEHGKHTESVIGASEVSQSYDIIYKRDF